MKLYISLDMEGIAGTFHWNQDDNDRDVVRKCIREQMEWVLQGIKNSKRNNEITEIVIADSHAAGDNLLYDFTNLDERISLISGYPRPQYMMPALDPTYDLVFFIGYHAGVGALHGSMDHTYSGRSIHKIWMNGKAMNESLINAAYAGYYNIPVGLVIGDTTLYEELNKEDAMPWVEYVATKEAISRFASKLYSIGKVKEETISKVTKMLNSDIKKVPIFKLKSPTTLRIEYTATAMADVASLMPHTKRIDGRTIEFIEQDYKILFDGLMALVTLGSSVK